MKTLRNYFPVAAIGGLLLAGALLPSPALRLDASLPEASVKDKDGEGFFIIRTKWVRAPQLPVSALWDAPSIDHLLARYGQ